MYENIATTHSEQIREVREQEKDEHPFVRAHWNGSTDRNDAK